MALQPICAHSLKQTKTILALMTIEDDETFLRLIWSPTDYVNGRFEGGVIPSSDFRGPARGCSVDRSHLCQRNHVEALAARQQNPNKGRALPLLAPLSHVDVRSIVDEDGGPLLEARSSPTPPRDELPENPAHAEVYAKVETKRSRAQKLREDVVAKLGAPRSVEEHFTPPAATE